MFPEQCTRVLLSACVMASASERLGCTGIACRVQAGAAQGARTLVLGPLEGDSEGEGKEGMARNVEVSV